jgi:hypothetical protein
MHTHTHTHTHENRLIQANLSVISLSRLEHEQIDPDKEEEGTDQNSVQAGADR